MSWVLCSQANALQLSGDNMFDIEKIRKMSKNELNELLSSLDSAQELDALAFCLAEIAREGAVLHSDNE